MKQNIVSVLVAAYNVEKTITYTIKSILNQTYQYVEIIVVNDGSKDQTMEVLQEFKNRITIIETVNQGLGAARNIALDAANGDYIMFMDGDDYFVHNNVISDMISTSERKKADIVIGDFNYVNTKGEILSTRKVKPSIESMYSGAWNKLYDKKLWSTKRFPEKVLYEDAGVIMSVGLAANKMVALNDAIYAYTQSSTTITQTLSSPERHLDVISALNPYMSSLSESFDNKSKSAVRYINHLILGHIVVLKMEYADSERRTNVIKELIEYMNQPLLKNGGFSSGILSDVMQKIMFWSLRTKSLTVTLNFLLLVAVAIRNRRRNKGKNI
ncbi:glycosyltransferase family 2 protein [Weissella soli]|uniref:glycosyltransferase family 2 protein n=1 Tax=Weissella soli TaxID=155866 RepID=UPI003C724EF8